MTDEVFEDLDHRHPRLPLVRDPSLATDAHDERIVLQASHKGAQAVWVHLRVGIDLSLASARMHLD